MTVFGFMLMITGILILFYVASNYRIDDIWLFAGIAVMIVGAIVMLFGIAINHEEKEDACKNIGGEYVVVDTETTMVMVGKVMTPQEVNVYGCVKE